MGHIRVFSNFCEQEWLPLLNVNQPFIPSIAAHRSPQKATLSLSVKFKKCLLRGSSKLLFKTHFFVIPVALQSGVQLFKFTVKTRLIHGTIAGLFQVDLMISSSSGAISTHRLRIDNLSFVLCPMFTVNRRSPSISMNRSDAITSKGEAMTSPRVRLFVDSEKSKLIHSFAMDHLRHRGGGHHSQVMPECPDISLSIALS